MKRLGFKTVNLTKCIVIYVKRLRIVTETVFSTEYADFLKVIVNWESNRNTLSRGAMFAVDPMSLFQRGIFHYGLLPTTKLCPIHFNRSILGRTNV